MLRVGNKKPHITEATDRWGVATGRYYVHDHFWVCPCEWKKLSAFQAPISPIAELFGTDHVRRVIEMKLKLNPARLTLWEFDALTRDRSDWVRNVIALGEPTLVRWTWWDAQVTWRLLKLKAWAMNRLSRGEER